MSTRCLLISSFNVQNLAGFLGNDSREPQVETIVSPYGQVMQTLMEPAGDSWKDDPDGVVVWTRPEDVNEAYRARRMGEHISDEAILLEVDHFASLLVAMAARVKLVLVPTWASPSYDRGFGMLDMKAGTGGAQTLMRMNLRLADSCAAASNIFVLDAQRWLALAPAKSVNEKLWYLAKVAFGNEVFAAAARDIKAAISGASGGARKLVIVDLDDTLWGGIVGDVGRQNLKLGGHDPHGEAFVDFQRALLALSRRGVILGIVSKNEEDIALEAIENHPEMVLRKCDFAGWRINWGDKALNIVELVDDLNLGLQSVVFIDDNPVERARVRDALPEVLVPEMPKDAMLYCSTLLGLECFDKPSLSEEDRERTRMYSAEAERKSAEREIGSLDEWLSTLEIRVEISTLGPNTLVRATQLLNKSHQMNLRTRRLSEPELLAWADQENHRFCTFRVSDRFGDSGLTGIASLSIDRESGTAGLEDFVLSCRVMGRKIEELMLHTLIDFARQENMTTIVARLIKTKKNLPCRRFFKASPFEMKGDDTFVWNVTEDFPQPEHIEVIWSKVRNAEGHEVGHGGDRSGVGE